MDRKHAKKRLPTPMPSSTRHSFLRGTVLNAFLKSTKHVYNFFPGQRV
jgi:hypothetical protein